MGFDVAETIARLEFDEDSVMSGARVRVSLAMSVRDFIALQRTVAGLTSGDGMTPEAIEQWEGVYRLFADNSLKSWDLERDGEPIPATADGFLSLPFPAANAIFGAWMGALGRPNPNSSAAYANGA